MMVAAPAGSGFVGVASFACFFFSAAAMVFAAISRTASSCSIFLSLTIVFAGTTGCFAGATFFFADFDAGLALDFVARAVLRAAFFRFIAIGVSPLVLP